MKKTLPLTLLFVFITTLALAQADRFWSPNFSSRGSMATDKAVARLSFPKEFRLFNLSIDPLREELFKIVDNSAKRSTIISLPNVSGALEQFEVYEASNFEAPLQARFPEIRAYSGKGITDKSAILKLSISPQGIQTMIFRTETENEFIEPYSADHTVYAVFKSQREKGKLAWTCSTEEKQYASDLRRQMPNSNITGSSAGELKTMRLAQSCNGEYANWFGATSSAQVALVLAAFNATLTRCNGCYEKDLALHLNLVPETVNVIYYDPSTDPYTTLANWNTQLQIALNTTLTGPGTPINVNNAAYDIGHMFGQSGGGGNAGCIGCVCVDGVASGTGSTKGRGITSPADGIPQGDNFDIDYVAHEVGHQLGGNHTFTFSNEGTVAQKEVGAGITIMGYAGITSYDPAPHSIDIFHEASIDQIQVNLATKTCPITTNITATNHTPVVAPMTTVTIPISTPFVLTGSATDADPGDVLTYCWEQNDLHGGQTAANSVAYDAKPTGPNWLSFPATTSPTRYFPRLSTVQAGLLITPPLPGGDAICNIEALSSVSRTLNFRLTVRDNRPYVPVSPGPAAVGQTAYTDIAVVVTNTAGPFQVTSPNTNVSWCGGSPQTITWDVNNTNTGTVNCANVKISLSTDGGNTFPTILLASTPNDGSESVTLPNTATTTARIKVEAVGNIFYDMSNTNFTITVGTPINVTSQPSASTICSGLQTTFTVAATGTSLTYQWQESTNGGTNWNNITNGGVYSGASTTTLTLTNVTGSMNNNQYRCLISSTSSCAAANSNAALLVVNTVPAISGQPTVLTTLCSGGNVNLSVTASGTGISYQWQISTTGAGGPWTNITNGGVYSGATTASLTITGVTVGMSGSLYRCVVSGTCAPNATSNTAALTVNTPISITTQPVATTNICATGSTSFSVAATGTTPGYQWQVSTDGGTNWTNITNGGVYGGATTTTLTLTGITANMTGNRYRCVVSGAAPCGAVNSNAGLLNVTPQPVISASPYTSLMAGWTTTLSVNVTPAPGLSFSWYLNGTFLPAATSNSLVATVNELGDYRVIVTGPAGSCQSELLKIKDSASSKLFVYPNPNMGAFTVTEHNATGAQRQQSITVYNSQGAKVYEVTYTSALPYFLQKIDLRRAGAGVYFVVLRDANGKRLKSAEVVVR